MSTTWQTVYEQIQNMLYKRKPEEGRDIRDWKLYKLWEDKEEKELSIHWLFSKDSWIMEFVEWKEIYPTVANLQAHYINMCEKTEEEKVIYFLDNAIIPWISK